MTSAIGVTVKIVLNEKGDPPGKVADAELHFTAGPLKGLKLIGFNVWARGATGYHVTFPARLYTVKGSRRSFTLLRPLVDPAAANGVRDLILRAYAEVDAAAV